MAEQSGGSMDLKCSNPGCGQILSIASGSIKFCAKCGTAMNNRRPQDTSGHQTWDLSDRAPVSHRRASREHSADFPRALSCSAPRRAAAAASRKTVQAYKKPEKDEVLFPGTQVKPYGHTKEDETPSGNQSTSSSNLQPQSRYDYRKNPRKRYAMLTGLNTKQSVAVTFHCILPKPLWQWNKKSRMYMRFEGYALGNWENDVGEFKEGRHMEEGVVEMICTLNVDAGLLNSSWGYKYVVYSPRMVSGDDCFEHLHTFVGRSPYTDPNRCLKINRAHLNGSEYHQYDFFVYPKAINLEKGIFRRGLEKSLLGFHSIFEREFSPPSTEEMVKQCFHFYLKPYKNVLLSETGYPQHFELNMFVREINHIFEQHEKPLVQHNPSLCTLVRVDNMKEEFKRWLEGVVCSLQTKDPLCRFISSASIACCVSECHVTRLKRAEFVYPLLRMLRIQPDVENKTFPYLSFLFDITSNDYRVKIYRAFLWLCKDAMKFKTSEACWDWLYVLPLCHFLSGACKPFADLDYQTNKFDARAEEFCYKELRSKLHKTEGFRFVNTFYTPLEPYFAADPLLLLDFVYLCPEDDYPELFKRAPAHVSLAWLSSYRPLPFFSTLALKWKIWLTEIKKKIEIGPIEFSACAATVNEAKHLVKILFSQLNAAEYQVQVINMSITLLLYALCNMDSLGVESESDILGIFGICEVSLQDWIKRQEVIGGSHFGYKPQNETTLLYGSVELKLWQSIVSLEVPNNKTITDAWNMCVTEVIRRRVKQVPAKNKIGLLFLLEMNEWESISSVISTIFLDEAIEAISNFGNVGHFGEPGLARVYDRVLVKKYPQAASGSFSIHLDDLLKFPYWVNFIELYCGSSKEETVFPHTFEVTCSSAISRLDMVFQQLRTGDITIEDLEKVDNNLEAMKRFFNAICKKSKTSQQFRELDSVVKVQLKKLKDFQEELQQLRHLCQMIPHDVVGLLAADAELQTDHRSFKINTLCNRDESGKMRFMCLKHASPLVSFAKPFCFFVNSILFRATWSAVMTKTRAKNPNLNIKDVETEVWAPVFQLCRKILIEMEQLTMTLGDVDKHFKNYGQTHITTQLRILLCGVKKFSHLHLSGHWIPCSVQKIMNYWQLQSCCDAANSFLELVTCLRLTNGNFRDIERIANRVDSMKYQTLADITDELVQAGRFLNTFTGERLQCIQCFCECQTIVKWIRNRTKDVSDLQNFVNVARATAAGGEDDFANDRLSSLRTVGSGYSSLIYNLKPDIGFQELCSRLVSVWKAYEVDKNLPQMLASCNKDLEWFKSVKETQVSIEVTCYGQMNCISGCGNYFIGVRRDVAIDSIHDVIHLTLTPQHRKKPLKMSYTLNELRELKSKLLLTGSRKENRAAVDQFLDTLQSACRIAEVLIELQRAGHEKYIGWTMDFSCRAVLVEDLQTQAREMEDELERWNKEMTLARKRFYELNYYTTRQVLLLRSELGRLKLSELSSKQHQWGKLMALLKSIANGVTPTVLANVVQEVANKPLGYSDQLTFISTKEGVEHVMRTVAHCLPPKIDVSRSVTSTAEAVDKLSTHQLSQDNLSIEQKVYLTDILENFGYSEMTALKAIEEVGDGDWNDIINWLEEHGDYWEAIFLEGVKEDVEESEVEVSDMDDSEIEQREWKDVNPSETHSRVIVTQQQHIDETNEEVQELLDAEMGSVEECIRAIELYGSAHVAAQHMMAEEETGALSLSMSSCNATNQQETNADYIKISVRSFEEKYLRLAELGEVLSQLALHFPAAVDRKRRFADLKRGQPHLLVVPPDQVLRTALSLYMEDSSLPLPTPEEMLICNQNTTAEEVNLLLLRSVCDPGFRRIFCLAHAERLLHHTADEVLQSLNEIIQGRSGYLLVIICSSYAEENSPVITKLHQYRRLHRESVDLEKCKECIEHSFIHERQPSYQQIREMESTQCIQASVVDPKGSCVRVISSSQVGMGKTLIVTRMKEKLEAIMPGHNPLITIPVHGQKVTKDSIMECLVPHYNTPDCTMFHFDISPSVLWQMDTILFSLLIQGGLCDSQGRVWRNSPSQLYVIEVTVPETCENKSIPECITLQVLEMLPTITCVSPRKALSLMSRNTADFRDRILMDQKEFRTEIFQRAYQYLKWYDSNSNLDIFSYTKGSVEGSPKNCLQMLLRYCGIKSPSWAEIKNFVTFLDYQLQFSERIFSHNNMDAVETKIPGYKSFIVKFTISMSRDFSTSSLRREAETAGTDEEDDVLDHYQITPRKHWETSSHPYLFFNQDGKGLTYIGFIVTSNCDLCDPAHPGVILEKGIMTKELYTGLQTKGVNFSEDCRHWTKDIMIQKISSVMGIECPHDPDPTYVLTVDNLIKILAIQMRFRCGIPVVLMGETGCGKTRLIRFMCNLASQGSGQQTLLILKVHGGTTEEDIITFLKRAEESAKENRSKNLDTVVLFDKANTTDAIGLIKEIMCDRRVHGNPVSQDLKFIAACNPYRRHTQKMISKLRSAGLGFYVKGSDTQQELGRIPLRELVYRVIDLPASMRPLVYDFSQLNTDTEREYTTQIVYDHVKKHTLLSQQNSQFIPAIVRVLVWSQKYMKERKDECCFVSLRDVERAMIVFIYFFEKMDLLRDVIIGNQTKLQGQVKVNAGGPAAMPTPPPAYTAETDLTHSLILAISVCYHARLSDRIEYEQGVAKEFTAPLPLSGGATEFRNVIKWCQEVLLESMVVGENIARNAALRENVFMMAVCVDLRIPLFLVGKPGSSKSLAKAIVADSMTGPASQSDLLKSFKQVHMFSYQCSQLSTPQSVIDVFNTAKRFQKNQDTTKYVSVVVLDEVGLAEDSPNLPLTALHPLLEDGTEYDDVIVAREKKVAFIGISNWALDPAKMNHGVMVTRGDPDIDELVLSAQGICHNERSDLVKERLSPYFEVLAEAYHTICERQTRQFFGLRDFYSLIKMLYWMCEKTNMPLTGPQLVHAIRRNFGGLEDKEVDPERVFRDGLAGNIDEPPDLTHIPPKIREFVNPDNTKCGLIKTSLKTKETSWHGENRYLLFLTEDYAALEILKQYLQDQEGSHTPQSFESAEVSLKPWEMEPFVLFGSSFPKDKEYTQVCQNINKIKNFMEIGRTVILLNLENLYESLYDVLNQFYIHHGGNRYVDLGLQTHKVKCRVHSEFKLILIAEKETVYEKFPTPLINKLEKHFVLYSSVLEDWQTETLSDMQQWIKDFSHVKNTRFEEGDAFVGYQQDVAAAVVFQASNQLRKTCQRLKEDTTGGQHLWESAWDDGLLGDCSLDQIVQEEEGSRIWKQAVLLIGQFLLLQVTSPAAVVRLHKSRLRHEGELKRILYIIQHHSSIDEFLTYTLSHCHHRGGLLLQVTTHSHVPDDKLTHHLQQKWDEDIDIHSFKLNEFYTEQDFISKVSPLFVKDKNCHRSSLLIIQCDSDNISGDLIAYTRHCICEMQAKALCNISKQSHSAHVVFIIHLPVMYSTFIGYPWISCHIDELCPPQNGLTLTAVQGATLSQLFYGQQENSKSTSVEDVQLAPSDVPEESIKIGMNYIESQYTHLHSCIQAAVSRLQDSTLDKQRGLERVQLLVQVIPKKPTIPLEHGTFFTILVSHIHRMLREREALHQDDQDWVLNAAMDMHNLHIAGTFMNVLSKKMDDIIILCLAEIIAFVDRSCNLSLLQPLPTPLSNIWLRMFASKRAEKALTFADMGRNQKFHVIDDSFACEFPFFWLVRELMDSYWESAQNIDGSNRQQVNKQLCSFASASSLGNVLLSVQDEGQCKELYRRYLHDFVHSVHQCYHQKDNLEYQLIQDSIHRLVSTSLNCSAKEGNFTLIHWIAAVHVVYRENSDRIHLFGQLSFQSPIILDHLVKSIDQQATRQQEFLMLHLYAVEMIVNGLQPPLKAKRVSLYSDDQSLRVWLNKLREVSNAIASTLSLPSQHPIALKARVQWQKIRAIQIFTEHVVLNHSNMIVYARQLELVLRGGSNFLISSTLANIKQFLNKMYEKKCALIGKGEKMHLSAIKESCSNFFTEIVSELSFGQSNAPEDQLVAILLDIVFKEVEGRKGTKIFTPFDDVRDKEPTIRSFLLQLILKHDIEKVKDHLKHLFEKCQEVIDEGSGSHQELNLLCIQCIENSIEKYYCGLSLESKMEAIVEKNFLTTATATVPASIKMPIEVLESVARVRYSLCVVAELLEQRVYDRGHTQFLYGEIAHKLLEATRHACAESKISTTDTVGKSNTTGPTFYLLKLLVCRGGFFCPTKIVKDPQLKWMAPKLLEQDTREKTLDPFVMYNPVYASLREEMCAAAYGREIKELKKHTSALQTCECVPLLLSVFEVCTMSRSSIDIAKQLLPESIKRIDDIILNCKALSKAMNVMGRKLVSNDQGGPLAALQVSVNQSMAQHSLQAVAVHAVATLICGSSLDLLCPLVTLLNDPGSMAQCYLPTMPEDMLPEVSKLIEETGQFYECPNGHPYFVGDCGKPVEQTFCITCGSAIGGKNYVKVADKGATTITDATQTGHNLGHPTTRSSVPSPERSLSPSACCIVRAIMHSALLWVSCNDDNATGGLVALVKFGLTSPQELPEFFWGHLERDLQLLAKALGKNPEDAAIVVHLVLRNIVTINPPSVAIPMKALGTKELRNQWENEFSRLYINPVLESLESELVSAMSAILTDDKKEYDPIYHLVYEHMPVMKDSLEPHLWSYRPSITLEHLTRYMQQQNKRFPILEEFLKIEAVLQATQYIPDIVKLQQQLFHEFHHRIDHKMAQSVSMHDFIMRQHTENIGNEYQKMVSSVQKAWDLVRGKLKDHGQLKVEETYLQKELGLGTTLEYFIPTTTGPGACTTSLVHYLCCVHNNFIGWCRAKSGTSSWHNYKIQLTHVQKFHLLDCQSHLQSILLSHCHYSLCVGQDREVSYDLPALEKCILDRFIHGKPTIEVNEIPHVSYQKDAYTAATFAAVRKKVEPQRTLQHQTQLDIIRELGSPDKLRVSLDVVEIVLGFLASGGGKPKIRLLSYLKKLKMDKRSFSQKAKEHCYLEHILSLWQTLSVGLAQAITLSGQEPFHTLNDELLEELTESQCQNLNTALPKVDLSRLLGTLYEFIETYIRYTSTTHRTWSLQETLPLHLEASNLEPFPDIGELPDDITLAQTTATWKYIIQFQAQQRQH